MPYVLNFTILLSLFTNFLDIKYVFQKFSYTSRATGSTYKYATVISSF